ncbi:MAG TPA: PD-(D/E)XK nuclease family protein, partial [Myxococcota bacterium]|nr:PD-(D/E)XK nuclease family protein [Myxococcota bacterium]
MGGVERVLEIAASTRVLRERRLCALDSAPEGAVLGREFVTFRGLAERCAAETDTPVRALLDAPGLTALVALCARGKGALGERLRERPGLAAALAATLRDLRDAGVPPDALAAANPDLARTYTDLERAMERLNRDGIFDRIGLFRLAQRGAKPYLARAGFARVEVHGATELVGSVGDLLAVLADALPSGAFHFFQPDFQSAYADELRGAWPWSFVPEPVEVVDQPALAPDGEISPGVLEVRRARSPRVELEAVAREVLALLAKGVKPSDIQIVARSLEPYAPWLEETLGGYGIPFTSSLAIPAVAWPARRAWLDLAHAVTRDLDHASVVRVAQSAELRVSGAAPALVAALAERVARERAVVRGETDWYMALENGARSSPEKSVLSGIISRLASAAREVSRASDFTTAADCLRSAGTELFGDASAELMRHSLAAIERLDRVRAAVRATDPIARDGIRTAFEAALLEPTATPFAEDRGGVRVLDAIQARAVPCRRLFLIGMLHGAWPRPLAEDPFLPDAARAALRARLRRPVPVRRLVDGEDRFLLGLLLSQARDHVVLSFSESDSAGRAQSPSALLRALPFVAARTDALEKDPIAWESAAPRFLRIGEALRDATSSPSELAAISARLPADDAAMLGAGLELVRRSDQLSSDSLPYDGEVGDALTLLLPLSPSQLEELGQCPLRALFSRFLGAKALDPRSADELEANEMGTFVHDALATIYSELLESGALARGASLSAAIERAKALVPLALDRSEPAQRSRVRERHPTAWAAFRATITRALVDFLERDLESLLAHGVESLEAERVVEATLSIGADSLAVKGKIDRIARLTNGEVRVGDYKTSRQFDLPLNPLRIRRGLALQVPLYTRLVALREGVAELRGETLTVPLRPERDRDRDREEERYVSAVELAGLSERALTELTALLRRG